MRMLNVFLFTLMLSVTTFCFGQNQKETKGIEYRFSFNDTLGQVTTYMGNGKVQVKMTAPQNLTEMTGGIMVFGEKGIDMFTRTGPLKKGQSKVFVFDLSGIKPRGNEPLVIRKMEPTIYTGAKGEDNPAVVWLNTDSSERRIYKGNGVYEITIRADEDVSESTYGYQSLFPKDTTYMFNTGPMKKGEQRTFVVKFFDYHEPKNVNK